MEDIIKLGAYSKDHKDYFLKSIQNGKWEEVIILMLDYKLHNATKLHLLQEAVIDFREKNDLEKSQKITSDNIELFGYYSNHDEYDNVRYIGSNNVYKICPIYNHENHPKEYRRNLLYLRVKSEIEDDGKNTKHTSLQEDQTKRAMIIPTPQQECEKDLEVPKNMSDIFIDDKSQNTIEFSFPTFANVILFSPDGQYLVSGSNDGLIEFWDMKTFKHSTNLIYQNEKNFMKMNSSITAITVSKDSKYVVAGNEKGYIGCFKIENNELIENFEIPESEIFHIHCDNQGKYYALTNTGHLIYNFFVKDQTQEEIEIGGYPKPYFCIYNNNQFVAIFESEKIFICSFKVNKCLKEINVSSKNKICCIFVHPYIPDAFLICGKYKIYSTDKFFNLTKEYYSLPNNEDDRIFCSTISFKEILYAGTENGDLIIYDLKDDKLLSHKKVHRSKINCISSHPTKNLVATCSEDGTIKFHC